MRRAPRIVVAGGGRRPDPLRGGARPRMVPAGASAPAASGRALQGLRAGDDRHLPEDPQADRPRSWAGAPPARLAAGVGEGVGRGSKPGRGWGVSTRVTVVGGVLAGISAALTCADAG